MYTNIENTSNVSIPKITTGTRRLNQSSPNNVIAVAPITWSPGIWYGVLSSPSNRVLLAHENRDSSNTNQSSGKGITNACSTKEINIMWVIVTFSKCNFNTK